MAASNINRVIITGNLTRDPELRAHPEGGASVCHLRIACNGRRRNPATGEWEDQPNFFDVSVWGAQGENCAKYLTKGRAVAIDGRLRWREWTDQNQQKRQAVDIIADTVQFLGGGREEAGGASGNGYASSARAVEADVPIDSSDLEVSSVGTAASDEDIPF